MTANDSQTPGEQVDGLSALGFTFLLIGGILAGVLLTASFVGAFAGGLLAGGFALVFRAIALSLVR